MSTIDPKPNKHKPLNPKLLPIAAILLIVLALLFMATPLLRTTRSFQNGSNFISRNGQAVTPNGSVTQPGVTQFQTVPGQGGTNFPARRFTLGSGVLAGAVGSIIYFVALIVSLAAALGMFSMRRWGKVLGIILAVLYLLVGLISVLPSLFLSAFGLRNPLSLILSIVHVLLAIAVIVLAAIPAKRLAAPAAETTPPAAV